ncbi:NACHT domain-containing protein [Metapseudomonas resinovorans]|uniref:NACHT domain-containing protein n=1 Tax=Metapseudomonas resinovorans TaxID=53412 RepID=UPI003D1B430B
MQFEAEVRWTAEAVWGLEAGSCQPSHYPDDPVVRELDGIARMRDITHLIMVTTSTKLDKAKGDVKKLGAAEAIERKTAPAVSKWLITEKQLDAEHIEHARKNNVTVLTLEQFKQRFFDGRSYLSKREVSSFGSARNPSDNSVTISDDAYVPLPMAIIEKAKVRTKKGTTLEDKLSVVSISEICRLIETGKIVVLIAPFGSGKSLTTREVFRSLTSKYRKSEFSAVPVCLNLREHWGQEYFDEILERHARSIGFTPKEDLVVAWRAGVACLLLDGFDELASQTIVRADDINFMREARRTALTGVRDFLTKLPSGMGTFICGRDHYFDSHSELSHAFGIPGDRLTLVKLDEFTEEGANTFLRKHGFDVPLPEWLPRKPLILSYLIQNDLLGEILEIDASEGYGYAWDSFIERITQRESELERAVMDASTLRNVMERLAFFVRSLASGNGPITGSDLAATYSIETGQSPGEGVLAQLQRLPGLTQREQEAGSRSFVDPDMLAALQGGAIARFISGQYANIGSAPLSPLSEKAVSVAAHLLKRDGATSSTSLSIVQRLSRETTTQSNLQLTSDCLAVSLSLAKEENRPFDCHGISIESSSYGRLDLEESEIRNLSFVNCIIEEVVLGAEIVDCGVTFRGCLIGRVRGVANKTGLPSYMFDESCEVSEFDNMGTNSAVLNSDLAPQVKALITILRKLYRQSGAGRKMSALSRGVTRPEVAKYIPSVLELLERHGFIKTFNQVVHPVRRNASRVDGILNAPSLSTDELIISAKSL